jgi:hypothetical protein
LPERTSRRRFLQAAATSGALLGLGDLLFLSKLRPVSAEEARPDHKIVRLDPQIEPIVRLLEDTPRETLLEEVAAHLRRGLSYRELLAALLLAGVRNIQPRPSVGFKFHAVLVVNSAHLASISSPEKERWLPIFWALDYFKHSQARDRYQGDWTMGPVLEPKVPPAGRATRMFIEAMERWDEEAADTAVAGLAGSTGPSEIFELFCRYGARDFRDIGHKAIFVANSWRTLQHIGWQHAEPVLRSLAYALLNHDGDNPASRDAKPDRPWRRNQGLAARIRKGWREGTPSRAATAEMLATLRQGSEEDTCDKAVELLNRGVAPESIWDALFNGAGEVIMYRPSIVALHAVTATNALHFAYQTTGNDETKRLMLLQNAAFLPLFWQQVRKRGTGGHRIDQLDPIALEKTGSQALEEIFTEVSRDRMAAARKTLGYLQSHPDPTELIDAARLLVFLKGNDAHDYKFSSAVLEDYYNISAKWRNRYLAASMFILEGSAKPDNRLVRRTRAALNA